MRSASSFSRSTGNIDGAQWAMVSREEYLSITRLRRQCCPAYAKAVLVEGAAETRLPRQTGVPDAIKHCLQEVEGVDRAPVRLDGPAATRLPEQSVDAADDISSEGHSSVEGEAQRQGGNALDDVPRTSIAIDPVHNEPPVQMMQAL